MPKFKKGDRVVGTSDSPLTVYDADPDARGYIIIENKKGMRYSWPEMGLVLESKPVKKLFLVETEESSWFVDGDIYVGDDQVTTGVYGGPRIFQAGTYGFGQKAPRNVVQSVKPIMKSVIGANYYYSE